MQNGELDGYEAKLVVWQTWGPGRTLVSDDGRSDVAAIYGPIIGEIRARQPQAKILLLAPVPRGLPAQRIPSMAAGRSERDEWGQTVAEYAAALAPLVDDETVFYADIGERFFRSDGSYNREMWGMPGAAGVGIQPPAYEVWAEELKPWIERFVL